MDIKTQAVIDRCPALGYFHSSQAAVSDSISNIVAMLPKGLDDAYIAEVLKARPAQPAVSVSGFLTGDALKSKVAQLSGREAMRQRLRAKLEKQVAASLD